MKSDLKKIIDVNNRISELNKNREELTIEHGNLGIAYNKAVESFALGEIDNNELDKVKESYEAKAFEIKEIDELIERVKVARKQIAVNMIPLVKQSRKTKRDKLQKAYDEQVAKVIEARNAFAKELAKLGEVKKGISKINFEYQDEIKMLGETTSYYDKEVLGERKIISGGWTSESDCLGLSEQTQMNIYDSGNVPQWISDIE